MKSLRHQLKPARSPESNSHMFAYLKHHHLHERDGNDKPISAQHKPAKTCKVSAVSVTMFISLIVDDVTDIAYYVLV